MRSLFVSSNFFPKEWIRRSNSLSFGSNSSFNARIQSSLSRGEVVSSSGALSNSMNDGLGNSGIVDFFSSVTELRLVVPKPNLFLIIEAKPVELTRSLFGSIIGVDEEIPLQMGDGDGDEREEGTGLPKSEAVIGVELLVCMEFDCGGKDGVLNGEAIGNVLVA